MTRPGEARAIWRIALLVRRADADWGDLHPELHRVRAVVDHLAEAGADAGAGDIEQALDRLAREAADCPEGSMWELIRQDLMAELDELREEIGRHAAVR